MFLFLFVCLAYCTVHMFAWFSTHSCLMCTWLTSIFAINGKIVIISRLDLLKCLLFRKSLDISITFCGITDLNFIDECDLKVKCKLSWKYVYFTYVFYLPMSKVAKGYCINLYCIEVSKHLETWALGRRNGFLGRPQRYEVGTSFFILLFLGGY